METRVLNCLSEFWNQPDVTDILECQVMLTQGKIVVAYDEILCALNLRFGLLFLQFMWIYTKTSSGDPSTPWLFFLNC